MIQGQMLWEVHKVTETRDSATFKTEYDRDVWLPVGKPKPELPDGEMYVTVSTKRSMFEKTSRFVVIKEEEDE